MFAALMACVPRALQASEPIRLRSGTPVLLELQHHISSAYTPPGSEIRFRVAEDVAGEGGVAIRKGTPVDGRMRATSDRAALGASGTMDFSVRFVTAVDGQQIRVVADESRRGRDRGNALAGWTILWGLPGLMTRGVHGWLERGATVEALVLHDRRIAPPILLAEAAAAIPAAPSRRQVVSHRFSTSRARVYCLDLERDKPLGTVEFTLEGPQGSPPLDTGEGGWSLIAVDDVALDDAVPARSARDGTLTFDSWSILRYCRHGATALRFSGPERALERAEFDYALHIAFAGRE